MGQVGRQSAEEQRSHHALRLRFSSIGSSATAEWGSSVTAEWGSSATAEWEDGTGAMVKDKALTCWMQLIKDKCVIN